jgi:hypothetical protein
VVVLWEMGWHPIDDHADSVLVAMVDEIHEVLRPAIAAGHAVIAGRLVTPTAGERMLADGQ